MKNKKRYNSGNSIFIYLPLAIIILFIMLLIKIYNSELISIASSKDSILTPEEKILYNSEKEKEEELPTNTTAEETKTTTCIIQDEEYSVVGALNIPSLKIEYPILAETTTELLKISVTKYWGANPNEVGNMVVLGHNYKNNKFFSNLEKIKNGEIIEITDLTGKTLEYEVYDTYVIDPYDNACTSQLTNGEKEVTLITCHYERGQIHATKRFVVKERAN